jgi:hypothetical protein
MKLCHDKKILQEKFCPQDFTVDSSGHPTRCLQATVMDLLLGVVHSVTAHDFALILSSPSMVCFLSYQALASCSYLVAKMGIFSVALSDLFRFLLKS